MSIYSSENLNNQVKGMSPIRNYFYDNIENEDLVSENNDSEAKKILSRERRSRYVRQEQAYTSKGEPFSNATNTHKDHFELHLQPVTHTVSVIASAYNAFVDLKGKDMPCKVRP